MYNFFQPTTGERHKRAQCLFSSLTVTAGIPIDKQRAKAFSIADQHLNFFRNIGLNQFGHWGTNVPFIFKKGLKIISHLFRVIKV